LTETFKSCHFLFLSVLALIASDG